MKKQCVELMVKEEPTIPIIQREFPPGNGTLNAWIEIAFENLSFLLAHFFSIEYGNNIIHEILNT